MNAKLISALFLPAICIAQTADPARTPVITFPTTHHDFGKIGPDHKVSYRFKVSNTGNAYLNITRLSPSCGCTYTMLGKWSLAPGEATEIEVSFNPAGFRGAVRKSLQVVSDDPANPNVTLTFEAEVIQDIIPDTTALFLNDLPKNSVRSTTLRLRSGNGKPVQVKEVKIPGATYITAIPRQEGNDVVLDISVDARKITSGRRMGADSVSIITTSERNPRIEVGVQWSLRNLVIATPDRVAWVEAAGKAYRQAITLKHVDGKSFKVLSARTTNPALRVEGLGKAAATQQELAIVLGADAKPGTYNEQVVLTLDDPDQPELILRASAVLR